MAQLLYPQGKSPWYPLDRRLGELQSWSGHCSTSLDVLEKVRFVDHYLYCAMSERVLVFGKLLC
jgi:hypothetical protein